MKNQLRRQGSKPETTAKVTVVHSGMSGRRRMTLTASVVKVVLRLDVIRHHLLQLSHLPLNIGVDVSLLRSRVSGHRHFSLAPQHQQPLLLPLRLLLLWNGSSCSSLDSAGGCSVVSHLLLLLLRQPPETPFQLIDPMTLKVDDEGQVPTADVERRIDWRERERESSCAGVVVVMMIGRLLSLKGK